MYELILWDVDATILSTGGTSGEAMRTAMRQVFGQFDRRERTFYSGKTDRQIIHETFPHLRAADLEEQLPVFREAYVVEFERRRSDFETRTTAMPGVLELIHSLDGQLLQAPLTGNIAPIARLKLDLLGLLPFLKLEAGAYGDDHDNRAQLVPIAAQRAAPFIQRPFRGCNIIVIGDTPNDIRCGKQSGTRTVAVATGPYSLEELTIHEPDVALVDLSDVASARAAILGMG